MDEFVFHLVDLKWWFVFFFVALNLVSSPTYPNPYNPGNITFSMSLARRKSNSAQMVMSHAKNNGVDSTPGFAACLLVMDDTIRLYEWLAYHYTTLPLTSLVIGIDKKSAADSIEAINDMARKWMDFGLNITIWTELPKRYEFQTRAKGAQRENQLNLIQTCTHHFIDKGKERWLLLSDTDEFLSFNYLHPEENLTHFDKNSIFEGPAAPSREKRLLDRKKALPIRQSLWEYHEKNHTILSLIDSQRALNISYFPSESGCTRIVGLVYGNSVVSGSSGMEGDDQLLMTRRYQQYGKLSDDFSKCMLEISKLDRKNLNKIETIHNVYPLVCGRNGKHSSGQDFLGSVLKVSHYIGSLESWLERGIGTQGKTEIRDQSEETWLRRQKQKGPFVTNRTDATMGDWIKSFVAKVGHEASQELLFRPLRKRIVYVREIYGVK